MDAGHKRKIEQLYLLMYDRLYVYAQSALRSEAIAEEAVQETFRIACTKPESLCASENPQGWLVLTLKNVIANIQRSRATANRIMIDYLSSQLRQYSDPEDRSSFEILYENVANSEELKLLKEMVVDGKTQLELAQDRGISLDACKKRVQRAKEVLRKRIGK